MNMKLSVGGRSTPRTRRHSNSRLISGCDTNHNSNNNCSSSSDNNSDNSLHVSQGVSYGGWLWWWWSGSFGTFPCHRRREFAYISFVTPQTSPNIIIRLENHNVLVEGIIQNQKYEERDISDDHSGVGTTVEVSTEGECWKDRGENDDDSSKSVSPNEGLGLFYEEDGISYPRIHPPSSMIYFLILCCTLIDILRNFL